MISLLLIAAIAFLVAFGPPLIDRCLSGRGPRPEPDFPPAIRRDMEQSLRLAEHTRAALRLVDDVAPVVRIPTQRDGGAS